jgi:integrase
VSIRKLADGRYEWRHRVGGRHLKKTFARRADAVSHDAAVRADAARGVLVDLGNKTTVAQFARAWSESRVLRPESRRIHESWLRNHVEGTAMGARPVVKVRPSEVQSWIKGRSAALGPSALAKCVVMLRAVFSAAVADGVCARNPVQPGPRLALPPVERAKFVPLTVGQVRQWAAHAPRRVRAMIITQAALGLRISELRGVRVSDVDFLRREVHIGSQLDPAGGHRSRQSARGGLYRCLPWRPMRSRPT